MESIRRNRYVSDEQEVSRSMLPALEALMYMMVATKVSGSSLMTSLGWCNGGGGVFDCNLSSLSSSCLDAE